MWLQAAGLTGLVGLRSYGSGFMANRPHMRGQWMDRESIALKQNQNAALGFEVICVVVGGAPLSSVGHIV